MAEEKFFSGADTITLVKQLIRYDIPFLLLGKSSIGKSYSVIEMTERWRMPKSLLYIGSEKPSNIEGLPRLTGDRAGGDTLEFYKPNWFPNTFQIEAYVTNGKKIFDAYIKDHYEGDKEGCMSGTNFVELHGIFNSLFEWQWATNTTTSEGMMLAKMGESLESEYLNTDPMEVKRELFSDAEIFKMQTEAAGKGEGVIVRDDVRDLCLYLSTMLGYGNFWLILDELDKVDESEQDKYAPLLHIVRERIIKEYSMRTLNNGKGSGVPKKVKRGADYSDVKADLDKAIELKLPLLDTRIIGIANATADIEDALFRRFCHLIVEEVMMVSTPPADIGGMRACLTEVTKDSNAASLVSDLDFKLLNEVNLQWQFSFFPTMLNKQDGQNNEIVNNFIEIFNENVGQAEQPAIMAAQKAMQEQLYLDTNQSALFKIIRNNFGVDNEMGGSESVELQSGIYRCLMKAIFGGTYTSEAPSPEQVKLNALKQQIADAIENTDSPAEAVTFLLSKAKREGTSVTNNTEAKQWMENTLGLVEESKDTSLRQDMVDKFYPVVIEFIAGLNESSDYKNQLIRWTNAFIVKDIDNDEPTENAAEVSMDALETLSAMNLLNAIVAKEIKAKQAFLALQDVGQIGAIEKLSAKMRDMGLYDKAPSGPEAAHQKILQTYK